MNRRCGPRGQRRGMVLLLLLLWLWPSGCGKKMNPLPPDSLLPGPVTDFTLRQEGAALLLSWRRPRVNIDGQPLTDLRGFAIWRGQTKLTDPAGCPPELQPWQELELAHLDPSQLAAEQILVQDDNLQPGTRYYYQVVGFDEAKQPGSPSPILSYAWDTLPQAPAAPTAQAGDRQVLLSWTPVTRLLDGQRAPEALSYNIYRRQEGTPWTRINPEPIREARFQDLTVANEVSYQYRLRAVRLVAGDPLESLDSITLTARPVDLTPPAPIQHLVAVPTRQGIELRWQPSPEADLAGYRVWRRAAAEPQFRLLTPQLLTQPYFVDREARKGQLYYYTVTAVDTSRRANESQPSTPATATITY